jgi:hypothetical protein
MNCPYKSAICSHALVGGGWSNRSYKCPRAASTIVGCSGAALCREARRQRRRVRFAKIRLILESWSLIMRHTD